MVKMDNPDPRYGGGNGGAGKEVPTAYLPDTFTQNDTGPSPGQFLGMLTTQPCRTS